MKQLIQYSMCMPDKVICLSLNVQLQSFNFSDRSRDFDDCFESSTSMFQLSIGTIQNARDLVVILKMNGKSFHFYWNLDCGQLPSKADYRFHADHSRNLSFFRFLINYSVFELMNQLRLVAVAPTYASHGKKIN